MIFGEGDVNPEAVLAQHRQEADCMFDCFVDFIRLVNAGMESDAMKVLGDLEGKDVVRMLRVCRRCDILIAGP